MAKARAAAVVTIRRAGHMTSLGRRRVASWLRRLASQVESEGHLYSDRFQARISRAGRES